MIHLAVGGGRAISAVVDATGTVTKVAVETATNVVGAVGGGAYRAVKNLTKDKKEEEDGFARERGIEEADGRTKRLAVALDRSQKGIEFWQNYIDNGFDKLMENAKRVQSGERSSFVRHKEAKKENQSRNTKKNRSKKPNQAGEEE